MNKRIVIAFLIAATRAEATGLMEATATEVAKGADCSPDNVKCASDHCCGTGVLTLGTDKSTPTMVCSTTASKNPDTAKYELWKCNSEAQAVGALKNTASLTLTASILAAFWTM